MDFYGDTAYPTFMKKFLYILSLASWIGFAACSSPSAPPPDPEVKQIEPAPPAKPAQAPAKKEEVHDYDHPDNVKEAFQKTGHEMDKGFKKAGSSIKKAFVGDDKDD